MKQVQAVVWAAIAVAMVSTGVFAKGEFGFSLGGMYPDSDPVVQRTFGAGFLLNGFLGYYDERSGWELRGSLGQYSVSSHNNADAGLNLRLNVTPIKASLIYHLSPTTAQFQPYVGGGVGAYMYNSRDDAFGELESGMRVGFHLLLGVKRNFSDDFYVFGEYSKDFVPVMPPALFGSGHNFDSSVFTMGLGWSFPTEYQAPKQPSGASQYSQQVEAELADINDLRSEIKLMKEKRSQIESTVDNFYTSNDTEDQGLLESLKSNAKILGAAIKITDPNNSEVLLDGIISSAKVAKNLVTMSIKKDRWSSDVQVRRAPMQVTIAGETADGFTTENIDKNIVLTFTKDQEAFNSEYRKIKYLEDKAKHLDGKIKDAESHLKELQDKWDEAHRQVVVQPSSTVYVEHSVVSPGVIVSPGYYPGYYPRHYRYYRPADYVVPAFRPAPVSTGDRIEFMERKKEHMESLRRSR